MITGAELYRRGYRLISDDRHVLRTADGCKLTASQGVTFQDGEKATAGELVERLESYKPPIDFRQAALLARRRHRREQRRGARV